MALIRRELATFKQSDVETPQALAASLNVFAQTVSERLALLERNSRMAVLDDVIFETGGTLAVNTAPFPIRVQTPFSVAGAWVVLCEEVRIGEAGVSTSGVTAWVRPVSGGVLPDQSSNAMEIQFIAGLAINRQYRVRLAVAGVKNG